MLQYRLLGKIETQVTNTVGGERIRTSQSVSPDTREDDSQNAEKPSDEAVRHKRKGKENPINTDSIDSKKATSNPLDQFSTWLPL